MRAAVVENGVVTNIIIISDGYDGNAIPTGDIPVAIGDTYDGTDFWRDGEKVVAFAMFPPLVFEYRGEEE